MLSWFVFIINHLSLTLICVGNILPSAAVNAAPSLQANARELEKNMRADSLEQKIMHRPQPDQLVDQGILAQDPRAT